MKPGHDTIERRARVSCDPEIAYALSSFVKSNQKLQSMSLILLLTNHRIFKERSRMEMRGIEPLTSALQRQRSPV